MASSTISLTVVTAHISASSAGNQWGDEAPPPLGVALAFAMPAGSFSGCRDWSRPQAHTSTVLARATDGSSLTLKRVMDLDEHLVECRATGAAWTADPARPHQFLLTPSSLSGKFTMSCTFSDPEASLPATPPGGWGAEAIASRTSAEWRRFWSSGAFLDLNAGRTRQTRASPLTIHLLCIYSTDKSLWLRCGGGDCAADRAGAQSGAEPVLDAGTRARAAAATRNRPDPQYLARKAPPRNALLAPGLVGDVGPQRGSDQERPLVPGRPAERHVVRKLPRL